jgi:hypothetical protein
MHPRCCVAAAAAQANILIIAGWDGVVLVTFLVALAVAMVVGRDCMARKMLFWRLSIPCTLKTVGVESTLLTSGDPFTTLCSYQVSLGVK